MSKNEKTAKSLLESFIDAQQAFMNTKHPHFKRSLMELQQDNANFGNVGLAILASDGKSSKEREVHETPHIKLNGLMKLDGQLIEVEMDGKNLTIGPADENAKISVEYIDLNGCKVKALAHDEGTNFVIMRDQEEFLHKEYKQLELVTDNDVKGWKEAFALNGILEGENALLNRKKRRNYEKVGAFTKILFLCKCIVYVILVPKSCSASLHLLGAKGTL